MTMADYICSMSTDKSIRYVSKPSGIPDLINQTDIVCQLPLVFRISWARDQGRLDAGLITHYSVPKRNKISPFHDKFTVWSTVCYFLTC